MVTKDHTYLNKLAALRKIEICLRMNDLFLPSGVNGLKIEIFTRVKLQKKKNTNKCTNQNILGGYLPAQGQRYKL